MGYCISMNNSEFFVSTENVGRFFAKARNAPYEFEFDDDGNITGIEHIGHNLGDDLEMFQSIAPFVAEGSFLDMSGEDAERWKWIFKDGKCQEIRPKLIWGKECYVNQKKGESTNECE